MIYKEFQGKRLSALGMGCMRFPTCADGTIDEAQTAELLDYAIQNGINYFDTAWGYHGGRSETVTGKLLARYPRERYYLASKFPGYDLSNMTRVAEIFEKQLEKTGAGYFDFYLFHNVCEANIDHYLDERYGIFDYLMRQKANGRIRHLGFSAHGNLDTMRRFLKKYGHAMEFGQLQVNWLDWSFQKAKEKIELLDSYGIPVWVMEPVRGGKLAALAPIYEEKLRALRNESVPAWAFRFLQSLPSITLTLSGMSSFAQLRENIETYNEEKPLNGAEMAALQEIAADMLGRITPCTSCRYCTEYCPQELNIPELLSLHNEHVFTGGGFIAPMRLAALPENKRPAACLACRACEAVCPQGIRISEVLADFAARLQ